MSIIRELKRRNVFRVAIAYVIVAWLMLQVSDTLVPALRLPEWFMSGVALLLIIGFPIALIFSWAFELTPDGLKKEKEIDRSLSMTRVTGRKLDVVIISVLVMALGYFAYDRFTHESNLNTTSAEFREHRTKESARIKSDGVGAVAVLQFKNLSDRKERYQYIVDGFREELVTSLYQVKSLRFTRGLEWPNDRTAETIAEEMGVDAIVSGSLRADGDRVRITADLISADGFQIWTGQFDGAAEDVFELQESVATMVRDAIQGEKGKQIRAASRPRNPEAFDRYMRGIFFLNKRDIESLSRARYLFQETIEIDPEFGPAYLRLAATYLLLSEYNPGQRSNIFQQAISVAESGIQADPGIRMPMQMVYGFLHHQAGNWAAAAEAFETAFRGVTVYPTTYQWHSRLLGVLGKLDESLEQAIAARSMEPDSQVLNSRVAISYFWVNDMENARHYFEEANNMGTGPPIHNFAYTLFLVREGRLTEARTSAKFALGMLHVDDWWVDSVFDGLARRDDQAALDNSFATIQEMVSRNRVPTYITMTLWSLFRQPNRAMDIAMAFANYQSNALYEIDVIFLNEFKAFRHHPQFPDLLQALGLTDYWDSIGCKWSNDELSCDTT